MFTEIKITGYELRVGDRIKTTPVFKGQEAEYSTITELRFSRPRVYVRCLNKAIGRFKLDDVISIRRVVKCDCCDRADGTAHHDIDGDIMLLCDECAIVLHKVVQLLNKDTVEATPVTTEIVTDLDDLPIRLEVIV